MDKKLTPIQMAITKIAQKHSDHKGIASDAFNSGLSAAVIVLESLLDKEKHFAEKVWNDGFSNGEAMAETEYLSTDFTTFYNQFNQTENASEKSQ